MDYEYKPAGRYFDEFEIGEVINTAARTITEADIVMFASLTGDFNPIHTDEESAKKSPMGTRNAHGALLVAYAAGLRQQTRFMEGTTIALASLKDTFLAPTRAGDTIHIRIEITDKKPSKSKPDRGLLIYRSDAINQNGVTVLSQEVTVMLKRKPE